MNNFKKLNIAIIADLIERIPPNYYGGAERVVYLLLKYLMKRGHDVTLFASDDSSVSCRLIPFGHRRSQSAPQNLLNLLTLYYQLLKMRKNFDVINCFGRLLYLLPLLPLNIIKVQTYACPINFKKISIANRLAKGSLTFVACSNSCAKGGFGMGRWVTIYNGIDLEHYRCNPNPQGKYLLFLGRLDPVKGAHTAIEVAKSTNQQLKLAGTIEPPFEKNFEYFKQVIQPQIDGRQIQYIGPVDDCQKNELLGEASALLFPIEWEEPFGLVMIEAMACGTPVIAFRRGAVPEILSDGLNGFICNSKQEMILAVSKVKEIDRQQCRRTVEMRFSAERVALDYEKLYMQLLGIETE